MSTKLKALGLGLFAMAAMGAFGVMNAGATGGGTVDVGSGGTTITGFEEPGDPAEKHNLEFEADTGGIIDCANAAYHGNTTEGSHSSISVVPAWSECFTTGSETKFDVVENGCSLQFTVGASAKDDNTVHVCQTGGPIIIEHPNCEITVEKQTVGDGTVWQGTSSHDNVGPEGVSYQRITRDNKHAITLESTAVVETQYHGGACQILGTRHTAEMFGSVTVIAENNAGEPVDLTATGTEE